MVNIIDFKTSIYNILSTVLTTYEKGRVPKKAKLPYITYELKNSIENNIDSVESVNFTLSINILNHDQTKDTTFIENKLNEVNEALNRKNIIEDNFYYYCVRQSINASLPTTDEFTQRREIIFTLKTYMKN